MQNLLFIIFNAFFFFFINIQFYTHPLFTVHCIFLSLTILYIFFNHIYISFSYKRKCPIQCVCTAYECAKKQTHAEIHTPVGKASYYKTYLQVLQVNYLFTPYIHRVAQIFLVMKDIEKLRLGKKYNKVCRGSFFFSLFVQICYSLVASQWFCQNVTSAMEHVPLISTHFQLQDCYK
jgi:hypothetical protein